MKKYLLGTLKNAKKQILKKFNFFRDAQRVAPKLCILSKNFIEQKSFRIQKYPLDTLKNAKKKQFWKISIFCATRRT